MKFKLYIQHSDKNRNELEDLGIMDVSSVIAVFNNFNWNKELKKIEERQFYNLTSIRPSLIIKKEDGDSLTINELDKDEFELTYEQNKKIAFFVISRNFNDNPEGISVEDCIEYFYENTLDHLYQPSRDVNPISPLTIGKYRPWSRLFWPGFSGFLLIVFGLILLLGKNSEKNDLFLLCLPIFIILLGTIPLAFAYDYFRRPKIDSLTYDHNNQQITLNYRSGSMITILKTNIIQIVYVFNDTTSERDPLKDMFSVTITIANGEQYYLTCLSFDKKSMEELLNHVGFNYYSINSRFPRINKKIFPKEPGIGSKNPEMKLSELEETYSEKSDATLLKIIENPEDYEPEAVFMAKKIIQNRKGG